MTLLSWLRHPLDNLWYWWKWQNRPPVGGWVIDCRNQFHKVVAFGDTQDDLILDDGAQCSWMHCCDRVHLNIIKLRLDAGTGFEPVTSWLWARYATKLRHPATGVITTVVIFP